MRFEEVLNEMLELHRRKNADYGDSYLLAARILHQPPSLVILSRIIDKVARAANLHRQPPQVAEESLRDTFMDIAVYAVLALCTMDQKALTAPKGGQVECDNAKGGREREAMALGIAFPANL